MLPITRFILFHLFNLAVFSSFLLSCCSPSDQELNSKVIPWAPYQHNQKITFINSTQDSVVFKVSQKPEWEEGNDQVCGPYGIENLETILINQADTAFQFNITLTQEVVVKFYSYYQNQSEKNVTALFNSVSEQYISDDWRDQYLKEINLDGKTYTNVLHVFGNAIPNQICFTELYYAPETGLIAFRNAFGMYYIK